MTEQLGDVNALAEKGDESKAIPRAKRILVLEKVRCILECFTQDAPELGFGQLRAAAGLPPSTCARLLAAMAQLGFLDRHGDLYTPGARLASWAATRSVPVEVLAFRARPVLEWLRDETGETASIYVRTGLSRTCIEMAPTRQAIGEVPRLGQQAPLHAGAAGKVFMAFDPSIAEQVIASSPARLTPATITSPTDWQHELCLIRRHGFATSVGERHSDAAAVFAPVFNSEGRLAAAVGVGGPVVRMDQAAMARIAPSVQRAAQQVSRVLGSSLS